MGVEGDIKACFDEISHPALMDRVRPRIADKRVLGLVTAFLKSGILDQDGQLEKTHRRHPARIDPVPAAGQRGVVGTGRIHCPVTGGCAQQRPERARRRRHGLPNYRLVRYADDWCLLVNGTGLTRRRFGMTSLGSCLPMGLRLSQDKTLITHIDDGLDFLGCASSGTANGEPAGTTSTPTRRRSPSGRQTKIKTLCRQVGVNQPFDDLLRRLAPAMRGWCGYLWHGVSVRNLLLPQPLHVASGLAMDAAQTPPVHLEAAPPPLPRRDGGQPPTTEAVRPREGAHHLVPISGIDHPRPWPTAA